MKIFCPENCGMVVDAADENAAKGIMEKHVEQEHGSLEKKHAKVLTAVRDVLALLASSQSVPPKVAKELHNQVSDLLAQPHLAVSEEPLNLENVEAQTLAGIEAEPESEEESPGKKKTRERKKEL